ncbi:glycosyltransferase family 2 protein [Loktanella sp. S4079]|uniref:glycosyltransferase family 2 protein n=1 Tax=Loktanella sp. S4079 TaxID=579483 RepID=UPI0005FA38CC|nr:glycosyltransferase family 2 protein [Loktanella sp. S4079]KJZ20665.1 spsA [Loktanella sp. S4079]
MTEITVIILCKDEAAHIGRAIASVAKIATRIVVVDSGSSDDTVAIAKAAGADILFNPWTTHARQFNWALDQIAGVAGWVLRLDADEVVTPELAQQIGRGLPDVDGIYLRRNICFLGQEIRYGGVYGLSVMRLFRNGAGRAEQRWMDEHIVVNGPTATLSGAIVDDNRKPLDWWITKHNGYASREVIDMLRTEFGAQNGPAQTGAKRWIKTHVYRRLPGGLRAGTYFFYRYVMRLGFLDGPQARSFHVLQGFWYRYLVDAKYAETRRHMVMNGCGWEQAVSDVLGVTIKDEDMR